MKNGAIHTSRTSTAIKPRVAGSKCLLGQKRKLVSIKPNQNSLLGLGSNNSSNNNGNSINNTNTNNTSKIKLTSRIPTSKQADMIRTKSRQGMNMVVVDVSTMACLDGCKVGDLVLVIGRVVYMESSLDEMEEKEEMEVEVDGLKSIVRLVGKWYPLCSRQGPIVNSSNDGQSGRGVPAGNGGMMETSTSSSSSSTASCGYVEARIIQVVNGTDMNLFQEALKMRREYLKEHDCFGNGDGNGSNAFDIEEEEKDDVRQDDDGEAKDEGCEPECNEKCMEQSCITSQLGDKMDDMVAKEQLQECMQGGEDMEGDDDME